MSHTNYNDLVIGSCPHASKIYKLIPVWEQMTLSNEVKTYNNEGLAQGDATNENLMQGRLRAHPATINLSVLKYDDVSPPLPR